MAANEQYKVSITWPVFFSTMRLSEIEFINCHEIKFKSCLKTFQPVTAVCTQERQERVFWGTSRDGTCSMISH